VSDDVRATDLAVSTGVVVQMPRTQEAPAKVTVEEQLVYARWLDAGMKIGLLLLTVTFAVYMAGALAPHVPVTDLPRYWTMPVKQYLAATGIHPGWGWVLMLGKGDFLNFVGIAFLAGVTIACYAAIIPVLFRKKDRVYAWLAVVEILVLALAASGVLKSGGH
jgi:hypothetical protein